MPRHRIDLSTFAAALAERLPGSWSSDYHRHAEYADQFTHAHLWDSGHAHHVVSTYVLVHDAILYGPEDQVLYVADRPRRPGQSVVAPLEPDTEAIKPHHFVGVATPHGIVVPNDPARAAARLVRRLLPRYELARRTVYLKARLQPEPPHRTPPPPAAQVITLTWYPDGVLAAPYKSVPAEARDTLYFHGFVYLQHQEAFVLPSAYNVTERALRLHAAAAQLAAHGIGVNLRHRRPRTSASPPPAPPQPFAAHRR